MEGLFLKPLLRRITTLLFQHTAIVLLLTLVCIGHSQISPSEPLIAVAGDDVVLPCQLEPPVDAVQMTIEWGKPDLNPRFVFVRHNGQELQTDQNTAYKGRVSLSIDKLKHGDVSLKLSKVKISDSGRYRCYIPQQSKEYFVELLVGASSQPSAKLAGLDKASSGVMLDCKSAGWYPEPEVIWMDGDGNLLSAGPTEALRGPDDLYTVSSRVTVEKRQNNNITCRVQQKNINQSRETHIYVPDDFFMAPASCVVPVTFNVIFCLIFVLAVAIFMWKNKMKAPTTECQSFLEDLGNKNGKLDEELKACVEKQNNAVQKMTDVLKEILTQIKEQKEQFISQTKEAERLATENEEKIRLVENDPAVKGDKAKGYLKLKEIMIDVKGEIDKVKQNNQKFGLNTDKLIKYINKEASRTTQQKEELEKNLVQIKRQMEEIESKRNEIQSKFKNLRKNNRNVKIIRRGQKNCLNDTVV
ncbi:butyrophilin subfamily 3 member A2-like [Oreochromis aureus]|uniref:Ig-like domain-containing protein n=1 Tax=Oreochromis aureus TaxID=47969 RepID=A0AAZ1X382_OREAU|nr:butyrophilin subfamily 3 member A2-like [Oreochromis aureus]